MKREVLIFFSYSGPSGILDSDGKQNIAKAGDRVSVRIVALSISFSWTDSIKPRRLLFSYIVGSLYFWRIRFSRLFNPYISVKKDSTFYILVTPYNQTTTKLVFNSNETSKNKLSTI